MKEAKCDRCDKHLGWFTTLDEMGLWHLCDSCHARELVEIERAREAAERHAEALEPRAWNDDGSGCPIDEI